MTHQEFDTLIRESEKPVILVEGTRQLPEAHVEILGTFASSLAERYPHALFRTGNAPGSDTAFAHGIADVCPERLQYVVPYAGHRKKSLDTRSCVITLDEVTGSDLARIEEETLAATPKYKSMLTRREKSVKLQQQALYVLRDTLKVIGATEHGIFPAIAGIFYVNSEDPMKGGTGHTVRACQQRGIPAFFQDEWMSWPSS